MWQNHSKYVSEYVSKKSPFHDMPHQGQNMGGGIFLCPQPDFFATNRISFQCSGTTCICAGTTDARREKTPRRGMIPPKEIRFHFLQ